jgi:RNA polymerase sigma-70 factor (ECF subfamily)
MDDSIIIDLYWQRDENAITQTDLKYGSFCHSVVINILSVRKDAEECVNDTYHQAWNSMPPHRPEKLKAWLGKVVRNTAILLCKLIFLKEKKVFIQK